MLWVSLYEYKKITMSVYEHISFFLLLPRPHGHAAFVPGGLLLNLRVVTQPTVCNA